MRHINLIALVLVTGCFSSDPKVEESTSEIVECWGPLPQSTFSFWYRAEVKNGSVASAEAEVWNGAYLHSGEGAELVRVQFLGEGWFELYPSAEGSLTVEQVEIVTPKTWNRPECSFPAR